MHSEEPFSEDFQQEEGKHLRDYLHLILKRKGLVLTVMIVVFLTVVLSAFSKTPIYTASTMVLIEKNMEAGRIEGFNGYMTWDPDFQATQFELIRSFNIALRVVANLHLDTAYRHYFFPNKPAVPSLSSWLAESAASLLTGAASLLNSFFASLIGADLEEKAATDAASSRNIAADPQSDAEKIAKMIQAEITVEPVRDTKIATVSYSSPNPELAQSVANAIVQGYIDETLDIKTSTSRHALQWMGSKAEEEQKKLEASEKALQRYMRDQDIVTVENRLAVLPERLAGFSSELAAAQTKAKEYEAIYRQIERAGKNYKTLEELPRFADSSVLQSLRTQIVAAEQNIRELSKKYGEKHPLMKQAVEAQQALFREKRAEIDRIVASTKNGYELAQSRVRDLTAMMNETKAEMLNMNDRFARYTMLKQDNETNRSMYEALASGIKKTNVTDQSVDVKIWAVKKAELPDAPSKPNKKRAMLLGLALGLISGIGLALLLDYLDNTAGSAKAIEDRYALTVLGSVENLPSKRNIETFILDHPLSPLAESYRLIRSGLLFSTPEHPPRTILITSMMQQEGKTTTTKNLAHILSQNEKKILIVDCDMRRPRQHSIFGVDNAYGLSNYLSGNIDAQQTLIKPVPDQPIALIPSGPAPPNPAELLGSKRMIQLLQEVQEKFDFILLDSPPVQQVTDSLMLGPIVDGTIVVIRAGKTTWDMLDSGIKRLRESRAHLLGAVLNRLRKKHGDRGYYGYYSYYSYYGKKNHYQDKKS